jgi:hypothetical protein
LSLLPQAGLILSGFFEMPAGQPMAGLYLSGLFFEPVGETTTAAGPLTGYRLFYIS